jgi:ribosomal protein S18 acetylase RimI-like enzyme
MVLSQIMLFPIEFTTEPATEEDKEFLHVLHRLAYKKVVIQQFGAWDEEWQRQYFEKKWPQAHYQIIEQAGRRIGVWVTHQKDHIFLNEIQLLPDFQGQGIGSTLIKQELEQARALNLPMRLRVLKANRARKLYERLGFVVYDETETHFLMENTG